MKQLPPPTQLAHQAAIAAGQTHYWPAVEMYTDVLGQIPPQTAVAADKELRLTALRERGRLLALLGEPEGALSAYEQYLREADSDRHKTDALVNVGQQSRAMGRYPQAFEAFRAALQLTEGASDLDGRAQALVGLGLTNLVLGRHEEAIDTLQRAASLFEQTGNAGQQIRTMNRLGVAFGFSGQMDKAIAAFTDALALSRKIGQQATAVSALNNLGECHQYLYDYENALAYHQEGLPLAQKAHLRIIETDISRNMGIELTYLGQAEEGLEYLNRALKLSRETQHTDNESQALYSLAVVEIEQGQLENAFRHATQLKVSAEANDSRNFLAFSFYALGLWHQKKGETAVAEQMWQQALFLAHEADNRTLLWKIHAALAKSTLTPELGNVHFRIAAEVIQQIAFPIVDEALRQKFLNASAVQEVLSQVPK